VKKTQTKSVALMLLSAPPSNAAPTQQQGQAKRLAQADEEEMQWGDVSGVLSTGDEKGGVPTGDSHPLEP